MKVTRLHQLRAEVAGACGVPAIGTPVEAISRDDLIWAEKAGVTDAPVSHLSVVTGGYGSGSGSGYSYGFGYGYGGSGHSSGSGSGSGYGYGYGYGDGDGGSGFGRPPRSALELAVEEYRAAYEGAEPEDDE